MRLDFFLLADSVEAGDGGKLTIRGAEVTRVSSQDLPFLVGRLASVAGFLIDPSDAGIEQTVALQGWNPDGSGLFRTTPATAPPDMLGPHSLPEGEEARLSWVVALDGLEFSMGGAHRIDLEVNGEVVGSRMLAVVIEPSEESSADAATAASGSS